MAPTSLELDISALDGLQDHELALWGVAVRGAREYSVLVIRGNCIGYVHATGLHKRSPAIRIAVRIAGSGEWTFGTNALKVFENTVVRGVRKCLWGDAPWPKHTLEFAYSVNPAQDEDFEEGASPVPRKWA